MPYVSLEDAATNGWEVERQYLCQAHGDKSPSASLNMNGSYICYACGDRGKLDMDNITLTPKGVSSYIKRIEQKSNPIHRIYPEQWLDIFDSDGPGDYWLSRYSAETCKHFRLGHTVDRSTYPMRGEHGEVLGVVYREEGRIKYRYPYGVRVSDHLFDFHRVESEDLVLTEGATDAMAVWEAGVPAGIASYRNGLSRVQADLIKRYSPRILWVAYDQDRAGEEGAKKIIGQLDGVQVRRLQWRGYKDLSEMPVSTRREVLAKVLT